MPPAAALRPPASAHRNDPDRFLAALTAPADRREHLFAVLARARDRSTPAGRVDDAGRTLNGGRTSPPSPRAGHRRLETLPALRAAVADGDSAALAAMVEAAASTRGKPRETLDGLEVCPGDRRRPSRAGGRAAQGRDAEAAVASAPAGTGRHPARCPSGRATTRFAGAEMHRPAWCRGGTTLAGIARAVAACRGALRRRPGAVPPPALRGLLPARLARVHLARRAARSVRTRLHLPDGCGGPSPGVLTGRWW
jgi:hypothetical protein